MTDRMPAWMTDSTPVRRWPTTTRARLLLFAARSVRRFGAWVDVGSDSLEAAAYRAEPLPPVDGTGSLLTRLYARELFAAPVLDLTEPSIRVRLEAMLDDELGDPELPGDEP